MTHAKSSEVAPLISPRDSDRKDRTMINIKKERDYWEDWEAEAEEKLFSQQKNKSTSLIPSDSFLLILHFLQLLVLLMSMALRWPWPEDLLQALKWLFFINGDVWSFMKLYKNGTYRNVQDYHIPSADMLPLQYWHLLCAWGGIIVLGFIVFIIAYCCISSRKHPFMFVQIGRLQQAYIILIQMIGIPFGTVLARIFHCNAEWYTDIDNNIKCYTNNHWAYITPALVFVALFYMIFPWWLISRTKKEMLDMSAERHEGYLQLKEVEYTLGLDVLWIVGNFPIFSSFRKRGSHFRAVTHIVHACVIVVYAAAHSHQLAQILTIAFIIMIFWIVWMILRPFRIRAFNILLAINLFCILVNCMMGALKTSFDSFSVQSIWLTPFYLTLIIGIINGFWVLCVLVFLLYLAIRTCCCKHRWADALWPTMNSKHVNKLSPETKKFIKAILKGRVMMEKIQLMPALFAPAHELARQIHIVNAWAREAEVLRDPMQDSLWDILDELIDVHTQVAPKSLFSESVKDSIRFTAAELLRMMPAFVRRLAQREYDFILVRPVKRRLLLKMYCMGLFLNNRKKSADRQRLTVPAVQRVWRQTKRIEEYEDDGYYEDIYPEIEEGPMYAPQTTVTMEMIDAFEDDLDDEMVMDEAEEFTKKHPLEPNSHLYTNLAFNPDEVDAILNGDNDSINLSQMLQPLPSRPGTANSIRQSSPRPRSAASQNQGSTVSLREQRPMSSISQRPVSSVSTNFNSVSLHVPSSGMPGSRPGSPGSYTPSRPGSNTGSRPNSATSQQGPVQNPSQQGSRPNSADGNPRSTPLPGMIDNTEDESLV